MENESNLPVGVDTRSQSLVPDAGISMEVSQAGIAFGDLVETTGLSVAETQNRLNLASTQNANALADTMMDVIAVQENIYDDEGALVETISHSQKLPLVNFIDPVFYHWSGVRLQGQYYANEFATAKESRQNQWTNSQKSRQDGIFVILGGGQIRTDENHIQMKSSEASQSDIALGRLRMNAMLKPRTDISIPKPKQVIRGPNLSILQGEIIDFRDGGTGPVTSRTLSIMIEYRNLDGTPIENKSIGIDTKGASWQYTSEDRTNGEGQIEILLTRTFLDGNVDTSPSEIIISARIGLVQNNTTVIF